MCEQQASAQTCRSLFLPRISLLSFRFSATRSLSSFQADSSASIWGAGLLMLLKGCLRRSRPSRAAALPAQVRLGVAMAGN